VTVQLLVVVLVMMASMLMAAMIVLPVHLPRTARHVTKQQQSAFHALMDMPLSILMLITLLIPVNIAVSQNVPLVMLKVM